MYIVAKLYYQKKVVHSKNGKRVISIDPNPETDTETAVDFSQAYKTLKQAITEATRRLQKDPNGEFLIFTIYKGVKFKETPITVVDLFDTRQSET